MIYRSLIRNTIIYTLLSISCTTGTGQKVETGLEILAGGNFKELQGKRVGLITNPTGVDRNLRSAIDILFNAKGVRLTALYSPEHGIRGEFTAGESVGSVTDPVTQLPVYSLYGKTRKPTPEMLKGIDVLVYDIQDIGSRSYTFISTLGLAMEAAAENNIDLLCLTGQSPWRKTYGRTSYTSGFHIICKPVPDTLCSWYDSRRACLVPERRGTT